ncbi:hypothetical protein JOC85_001882 [Bacillus mesophilus]|nr:hypothetical protein [Bacillus mesophilus]
MSMRNKIICSLLVMIGIIFSYLALQSNLMDTKLGYSFVAIIGFMEAYIVTKRKE